MKYEIKDRWTGAILYAAELTDGGDFPIREVLQTAVSRGADLRGAYLGGAYLRGAYLGGAYLRGAYLGGAYLRGADLGGADLGGADLGGAYLGGADLGGADLGGAYLRGAYLGGAYLRGAYRRGADLGEWIIPFVRIGACGEAITWLAQCRDANTALAALCEEWRKWLEDAGAPIDRDGEAIVAWAKEKAGPDPDPAPWHALACDRAECAGDDACKMINPQTEGRGK